MTNRLAQEASPYLQQHAGNPVDWYPWGEEAFLAARERNVPVHLSIGYFACHWCHVMAHECFENEPIARYLNENFVNIKVDRQERPDIDDVYQRVIQMMGQSGGWPLTVFLTPDQQPFFAGTYFPPQDQNGRPGLPRVLQGLTHAWRERPNEVRENCAQFLQGYKAHDRQLFSGEAPQLQDAPADAAFALAKGTDAVEGGIGGAPKFPNPSCFDLMLRVHRRTGRPELLAAVERTLAGMARGGIYDHLGGGFARYSVDATWTVPHFEKMLYDNAQLTKLYADTYRHTQDLRWLAVAQDCVTYVLRDLTHAEGAFFASEDADSEGEEGRFYIWNPDLLRMELGEDDSRFACLAYGVTPRGNFERGYTVLQRREALDDLQQERLQGIRRRLLAARNRRVRPARDESILAGWNGLMLQGLSAVYQATGDENVLTAARRAADFLHGNLRRPDGGLYRSWRDGVAKVNGFLEDYAFLANGLLDLYESDFDRTRLEWAGTLIDRILADFWDDGLHFTPRDAGALVHRPIAPFDHAWPSGHSETVFALLRASEISGHTEYREHALKVIERFASAAERNAFGFAHLLAAKECAREGPSMVVFSGSYEGVATLAASVHRHYHPGRMLVSSSHLPDPSAYPHIPHRKAAAYVCRDRTCLPPAVTVAQLTANLA